MQNLHLYLIKHLVMKVYGDVKALFHKFLTSELGGDCHLHAPLPPEKEPLVTIG
jgi:hypothetical protein